MRLQGALAGNDYGRALVGRVHRLIKARPRWARTRANGRGLVGTGADSMRGHVGPGVDSSRVCNCRRTCVGRKRRLMGAGG
jgi:hypothetical protein